MKRFGSLYCLLTVGMLGMTVTGDLFNFFVFIEIASIASFGLIAFWRDKPEAIEASFKTPWSLRWPPWCCLAFGALYGKYNALNMAAIGSLLQTGFMEKIVLVFIVVSLACKCGAFPMHMWLPDSYAEAPSGVSCLLVAVSQASLYGLVRVCFSIYGGTMGGTFMGWGLLLRGRASMFFGVSMAWCSMTSRGSGYHSVSQVGYMLLGFGVGLRSH